MEKTKKGKRIKSLRAAPAISITLSLIVVYLFLAPIFGKVLTGNGEDFSEDSFINAAVVDFGNYKYPYYLGVYRLYSITNLNTGKAILYFKKALTLYPFHRYSWLGLARAYYSIKEKQKAYVLLDRILQTNNINRNLLWDSGIFLLARGEFHRGLAFLGKYLILEPGGYERVFDLCYRFNIGAPVILSNLLNDSSESYNLFLRYLVKKRRLDDIRLMWQLVPHEYFSDAMKLSICNLFIDNKMYDFAEVIWNELSYDREDAGIIQNGDFEYLPLNGCFDWTLGRAAGVRVYLENNVSYSGKRSIGVGFDGEHNPGITILRQVVPVAGGRGYRLTGRIKTDKITTTNGLFYEVRGHKCGGFGARSDLFTGTNPWTEAKVEFTVPDDCNAVVISIKRERSYKFNNKIKGQVWVDRTELTQPRM